MTDTQVSAWIAINKNRVRNHEGNVYLKDGTEFQIELYNPRSYRLLTKIAINGQSITGDGGIVLRPGERVFLDRYLNEAKKFLFETYKVANTEQNKTAIANNGSIEIGFYRETHYLPAAPLYWNNPTITWINNPSYTTSTGVYDFNSTTYTSANIGGLSNTMAFAANAANVSSVSEPSIMRSAVKGMSMKSDLETGRVEKGSHSDQNFNTTYGEFQPYAYHSVRIKLLPESQKLHESNDIRNYCSNCGRRSKNGERFCPSCGTKF